MIKLKLETLVNPAFQQAFMRLAALPLAALDAYRLSKTLRIFQGELEAFDKARQGIVAAPENTPAMIEGLLAPLIQEEFETALRDKVLLPAAVLISAQDLLVLDSIVGLAA